MRKLNIGNESLYCASVNMAIVVTFKKMDWFYFYALIFSLATVSAFKHHECHNWTENYKDYLGTKTPYRQVANMDDSPIDVEGCKAQKLWMLVRHGTRYPGVELISDIKDVLLGIRDEIIIAHDDKHSSLCDKVIKSFQDWIPTVKKAESKQLAHEGEEEMIELAERFVHRLPNVFPKIYSSQYQFRTTKKQRTLQSLRYFLIGLFGRQTANAIWPVEDPANMRVLRFYKECPRWKRDVDDNPLSLLERMKLEASEEWWDMTKHISERLGLKHTLQKDALLAMYKTCGFETAWYARRHSPWCAIFTDDELAKLEYAEDLEYYHIDGYGYPLNYLQACPAVQDLVKFFSATNGSTTSISFTHSGTILKFLAHFGLYNETVHFNTMEESRQWRVGRIDAFGSNIAFVLYKCGLEKKVMVLHQEHQIFLPKCPASGLCPLNILLKEHGGSLDSCQFDEMCRIPENNEVE